ncbi:MAG: amino acid permease [Candidatus Omnitrophica bacterium]|nr:amino acid permease [Candidatus Omnitrophota bacterium]
MNLRRNLNLWDIFCIAAGAMISSGLFVLPALAYRYSGPSIVLAYFVAGLLMIPSMYSKSELLSAMPKAGGTYFFIERSFGPFLGIFGGLASWFSLSLKSAFALVGIGVFMSYFIEPISDPQFYLYAKLIAAGFCVFFVLINLFSVHLSSRVQNIMVLFLLVICSAYVVMGMRSVSPDRLLPFFPESMKTFLGVVGMVFISYGGLTKVASIAEDTYQPSKNIPRGMFLAFIVVQLLYVLCVAVTIGILSPHDMGNTLTPLSYGAMVIGGSGFRMALSIAALIAFFTTANAGILSSSRIPFAMGKDGLLPGGFSRVSLRFRTPYAAILTTGAFMLLLILFLDLEVLVKTASTLMLMLFMFENLSVIIMRESKIINYRPLFKSPAYPWMQIFALIVYGFLIVEMGIIPLAISLSFIAVSLVWFFISARKFTRQSALMHLVERITAKELVDTSLEEELKEILHKRDNIVKDRFDHLIESCRVIDLTGRIHREVFFSHVADVIAQDLNLDKARIKDLLIKREAQSTTVIEKGLAIPHIVIEGEHKFDIVVARSKEGIVFPGQEDVHVAFVLIGSKDERNFHLRTLMAIAQIVREHNFYKNFMRAKNEEQIRMLVLSSTRRRDIYG